MVDLYYYSTDNGTATWSTATTTSTWDDTNGPNGYYWISGCSSGTTTSTEYYTTTSTWTTEWPTTWIVVDWSKEETEQQKQEREERQRQAEEQQRIFAEEEQVRREARKTAQERARELLLKYLSPRERKQFNEIGGVAVKVGSVNYLVRLGRAGNIDRLRPDGTKEARLCVHVEDRVPDEDNMLAQLLFLRTNPEALLSKANVMHY